MELKDLRLVASRLAVMAGQGNHSATLPHQVKPLGRIPPAPTPGKHPSKGRGANPPLHVLYTITGRGLCYDTSCGDPSPYELSVS